MEFAGFELTLDRVLVFVLLVVVLLVVVFVLLVVNIVQQRRTQAVIQQTQQAVQQTQQAVQQTRVELKQFKEDVPHRESQPFPHAARDFFRLSLLPSLSLFPHKTNYLTFTNPNPILIRRSVYRDV